MTPRRHYGAALASPQASVATNQAPTPPDTPPRRRARLRRGPLVIGEPAVTVRPKLAAGDPYRPDSILDGGSVFDLTVRAASVRGLGKRWGGGPRQDDLCLGCHEPTRTLIAAVADGVSGAPRSDLAAALAVRHAVAAVTRQLDDTAVVTDWKEVFGQAAWGLVEEHRRASGDSQAGVEAAAPTLSTTLLVATVSSPTDGRARVRLASVGDSCAFLLRDGRYRALVGDQEVAGELIGGSVRALPRGARNVREAECELHQSGVLLLGTDGFALPLAGGAGDVGATFARELSRPPDILDFARLLDFSRSTYDDDRSLIAVWAHL